MIFYFLECFFIFYPKPHSTGNTALSNISWAQYYNRPINEYNFRGNPIGDLEGKKKIYVIGDSYTCGWGVKNVNQRYPEILEKNLGEEYRVINMGVPGFGMREKIFLLNEFINVYDFKKPDLIVWQYLVNDIIDSSRSSGHAAYVHENKVIRYFVKNSFFLNFLYWLFPQSYDDDYANYITKDLLNDQEKIDLHLRNILAFVNLCKEKQIPLIVIGFPFLNDLEGTCPIVASVEQVFGDLDIEFVNMCKQVRGTPVEKLEVHCNDHHPSVYLHELVAKKLYKRIKGKNF